MGPFLIQNCFMFCLLQSCADLPFLFCLLQWLHAASQRVCSLGWWQVQEVNLFESLNITAEQLSNYTNKQEFKGSGHNLLQLFCSGAAFGTSFHYTFPHLNQNYVGWKSSESWYFLEALHFRISFQGTGEEITLTHFLHFELQIFKKLNCFCSWKPEDKVNKCLFF